MKAPESPEVEVPIIPDDAPARALLVLTNREVARRPTILTGVIRPQPARAP
ncbi:hypothetical protein [Streptomyces sp. NPDC058625]|uniref:hypothetical protein n=1 Tax=Streptomyces sp. NPDC058625 TaxID=3346564 RepID=UPI003668BC53